MKPFYMWAGGKSRLLKHYAPLWTPKTPSLYVEPFFGGGAVYGWLAGSGALPEHSLVNDTNAELMGVLRAVRDDAATFLDAVDALLNDYFLCPSHTERKAFYYDLRARYWNAPDAPTLFVLMRLGFNGIWQTCKDSGGLFGTPCGLLNHVRQEQIYKRDEILAWSIALQGTTVEIRDYANLDFDPNGALIYLDPPYRDSFTTYGTGFNDDDQRSLASWAREKHEAGATVLLANRHVDDDPFFEQLLSDVADFHYFDITYTAGRRKRVADGFEAKKAREFLAILS